MPAALPTQKFIEVDEIKEGVMILKNKSLRSVLICSSVNFELKSTEEQEATLFQFQNFLNSLDFSLQILVRSRRLDINKYLDEMKQLQKEQEDELMRIQIEEYVEFIEGFVALQNIMSKTFYTIVPLDLALVEAGGGGILGSLLGGKKAAPSKVEGKSDEKFQGNKDQLIQRVSHVIGGLRTVGIRAIQLGDEELKEFLFKVYNP